MDAPNLTDKEMEAGLGEPVKGKFFIVLGEFTYHRADGGGWEPYPTTD